MRADRDRPTGQPRQAPRALTLAFGLLLSVLLPLTVARPADARHDAGVTRPDSLRPATGRTAPVPSSPGATTSGLPATTSPSTAPTASDSVPSPSAIRAVAAAVPTAFVMSGPRFTIDARVCTVPAGFPLSPRGDPHSTVCLVGRGFGGPPGSDTATSYLLGYASAADPGYVLDPAAEPATAEMLRAPVQPRDGVPTRPVHVLDGYLIRLTTPAGVLTYRVGTAFGVPVDQLGRISVVMDQSVPRRVVLITSAVSPVAGVPYNLIVFADLVAAAPA